MKATFAWKMTIFLKKMPMVGQSKGQSRLRPEGDIEKVIVPSDSRRPWIECVGDQKILGIGIATDHLPHKLIHTPGKIAHDDLPVLLKVKIAIELQRQAVADGGVAYVEARPPRFREQIDVAGAGAGELRE